MTRRRIYETAEEQAAARRARDRGYKARKYWAQKLATIGTLDGRVKLQDEACDPRPPPELIMERDFRSDLIAAMSSGEQVTSIPPRVYAGDYYHRAWHYQRRFAQGRAIG